MEGHQEIVRLLLTEGADISAQGRPYGNVLQAAAQGGHPEIIELLLERGVNHNYQRDGNSVPLYAAAFGGHQEIIKLLLGGTVNINYRDWTYDNALQIAARRGHLEVAKLFLERGANPNNRRDGNSTPLYAAAFGGHQEIIKLFLERGADIDAQGGVYGNALQAAVSRGHLKVAGLLLDRGADVNTRGGGSYNAPLYTAALEGYQEIVRLLLGRGASVGALGGTYGNALQAAAQGDHPKVVQLLLERGADVDAKGGKYGSALQAAASKGYLKVLRLLLDAGTDVNAQGGMYGYALNAAASEGHQDVVQLLVDRGADIDAQGGCHGSALRAAAYGSYRDVVGPLLDRGADPFQAPWYKFDKSIQDLLLDAQQKQRKSYQTYHILSDNPACKLFEDKRQSMLAILDDHAVDWVCLNLLFRGRNLDEAKPTVVIISGTEVDRETRGHFEEGLPRQLGRCEWVVGDLYRGASVDIKNQDYVQNCGFYPIPNLGASVGVKGGNPRAGTIGGYIKLKGSEGIYALTCHHVITKSKIPVGGITAPTPTPIFIEHPAMADRQRFQKICEEGLEHAKSRFGNIDRETDPEGLSEHQDDIVKREEELATAQDRIKLDVLGEVTQSWRFYEEWRLHNRYCRVDWAICKLGPTVKVTNSHPRPATAISSGDDEIRVKRTLLVEDPAECLRVGKFGRTTGYTTGNFDGVSPSVRLGGARDEGGIEELMTRQASEWSVVGEGRRPFSDYGDSGAWVIDESNHLVGLIWGGFTNEEFNIDLTFVTPIGLVFESIKSKTGYQPVIYNEDSITLIPHNQKRKRVDTAIGMPSQKRRYDKD